MIKPSRVGTSGGVAVPIGASLQDRQNSLNFLRLALAAIVLIDHGVALGGFGGDVIVGKTSPAVLAVYGFFGISGYLIVASAARNTVGRYVWMRVVRIFPAFLVCLVLTSFLFGLIGWYHGRPLCGFRCYVHVHLGPLGYIWSNLWLRVNQPSITGTLKSVPFGLAWNGSLWTLFYEFLCYLLVAFLAFARLLRQQFVLILAEIVWVAEIVVVSAPRLNARFNFSNHLDVYKVLEVFPIFLVGAVIYLYRNDIPDSGRIAVACVVLFGVGLLLPLGGNQPGFQLTSSDLAAPLLVYPMLWLGIHLPFQRVGAHNDYSYGVYIYAYPLSQLLALWGAQRFGVIAYLSLIVLLTSVFASASWWLVERPALKLRRLLA
jgi:peptidoglycan/LPS O-acetylase OafA/YrhL